MLCCAALGHAYAAAAAAATSRLQLISSTCLSCPPVLPAMCLYCLQIQVHSLELKLHKRRLLLDEATDKCDLCQEGHELRRR